MCVRDWESDCVFVLLLVHKFMLTHNITLTQIYKKKKAGPHVLQNLQLEP